MPTVQRSFVRSTAAIAVAPARELVSFVVVNLLGLALILNAGAELLRGP